jgi:hypothetical protein
MIDAEATPVRRDEMILHVQYKNFYYDYVDILTLDRLLEGKSIRQFYRPSEKRWIDVSLDPIRGRGGRYQGVNRRQFQKTV